MLEIAAADHAFTTAKHRLSGLLARLRPDILESRRAFLVDKVEQRFSALLGLLVCCLQSMAQLFFHSGGGRRRRFAALRITCTVGELHSRGPQ